MMRPPRMTTRRWMVLMALTAVSLAARDRIIEAYDAYRFHERWDTRDVTGMVTALDPGEAMVTVSLGSDDGIARGEVLYLFREAPATRYIGKVSVTSVADESAVGWIFGGVRGLPVREGDGVAHLAWVKRRHRPLCSYVGHDRLAVKPKPSGAHGD